MVTGAKLGDQSESRSHALRSKAQGSANSTVAVKVAQAIRPIDPFVNGTLPGTVKLIDLVPRRGNNGDLHRAPTDVGHDSVRGKSMWARVAPADAPMALTMGDRACKSCCWSAARPAKNGPGDLGDDARL
ncbi:hypothetical protein M0657_002401 [Pyricularia oryzae]|nr:hypothetical protein M9X92_006606 [Pyricularia oryzae]KAI7929143.1 hypothetical protein M0657_002401 [Pyricularia oryzae]